MSYSTRARLGTRCYCCGPDNPEGLHLEFSQEPGRAGTAHTRFTPPEHWVGWEGVLHGGFQSLLLDETLSWAVSRALPPDMSFVTGEITVRFMQPVPVGRPLTISGEVTGQSGVTLQARGTIQDADGQVLTRAQATFVRLPSERAEELVRQVRRQKKS